MLTRSANIIRCRAQSQLCQLRGKARARAARLLEWYWILRLFHRLRLVITIKQRWNGLTWKRNFLINNNGNACNREHNEIEVCHAVSSFLAVDLSYARMRPFVMGMPKCEKASAEVTEGKWECTAFRRAPLLRKLKFAIVNLKIKFSLKMTIVAVVISTQTESKMTTNSNRSPLSKIFLMLRAIDVQFHRWCLNWYSHSRNPMLIPSLISRIMCVSFLHISLYLPRNRLDFLHIKYGSNKRLLPSALKESIKKKKTNLGGIQMLFTSIGIIWNYLSNIHKLENTN